MTPGIRLYAIILHYFWALMLIISARPVGVTAVYNIVNSPVGGGNRFLTAFVLALAASAAAFSFRYSPPDSRGLICLGPQALLLALSAAGAITAIINHAYADGEPRSWTFIATDQAPAVFAFLMQTAVVIRLFGSGRVPIDENS